MPKLELLKNEGKVVAGPMALERVGIETRAQLRDAHADRTGDASVEPEIAVPKGRRIPIRTT